MTRKSILTAVFGLFVAVLVSGLAYFQFVVKPTSTRALMKNRPATVSTVSVAKAASMSWQKRLRFPGDIAATRDVGIAAQSDGTVVHVGFSNGSFVKAGELLFALDTSVEEANRVGLQVALREAQSVLDRQSTLARHRVSTKAALDAATSRRDEAAAEIQRIDAVIAQKNIKAPFDGWAGITQIQSGDFVTAGSNLVKLHKRDDVFVEFSVSENQLGDISIGDKVQIQTSAHGGTTYSGTLATLGGRIDPTTRTMKVRARVANPRDHLLPGMSALIDVLPGRPRDVVTVPRTAVVYGIGGTAVYIAKPAPAGKAAGARLVAERRPVRVGHVDKLSIIVNSGLKVGELVVTSGQNKLKAGSLIRTDGKATIAHSSAHGAR